MDQRQPQSRQPSSSSSQNHLRPPPHHRPSTTPSQPSIPRAPVTAHPTATIAESTIFQGTYLVSIGAGTIIHPRTKIYSTEGPVIIGEGCIINEKCIIGTPPASSTTKEGLPIQISSNVTIGPLVTVHPGTHIHSAAVVETLAVINRRASVGAHSKICARCEIAPNTDIKEWSVVWGVGKGVGLRRRVRAKGRRVWPHSHSAVGAAEDHGMVPVLEGRVIEDARLMVMNKEREALVKFIAPSGKPKR